MQNNLEQALENIFVSEGAYTRIDGGTMYGITRRVFETYTGRRIKPHEMKTECTKEIATAIYKRNYARMICFNELPIGLDYAILDFAVNSGMSRAAKKLQKMVGAKVDGYIGLETLDKLTKYINKHGLTKTINDYMAIRLAFLKRLKRWKKYGKGWANRVNFVTENALKMVKMYESVS